MFTRLMMAFLVILVLGSETCLSSRLGNFKVLQCTCLPFMMIIIRLASDLRSDKSLSAFNDLDRRFRSGC